MDNANTFTILIKKLRNSRGITLRGLSAQLNIAPAYYCDLEKGNRNPTEKFIKSLIDFYELDYNEQRILYDAAAEATGLLPYDVVRFLKEKPDILQRVKESMMLENLIEKESSSISLK